MLCPGGAPAKCAYGQARKWGVFRLGNKQTLRACHVGPLPGTKQGISVPSDGPIFMQRFALTVFKTVGDAVLYQNAIFPGFLAVW